MDRYITENSDLKIGECGMQSCPPEYERLLGTPAIPSTCVQFADFLINRNANAQLYFLPYVSSKGRVVRSGKESS